MHPRHLVLAALAVTAACHGGPPPSGPRAAAPAASGLAASLEAELGQPVAIVPSAQGLLAVSADGQHKRVLVPGAVAWALVDNRAGVVWFGPRDAIRVLDLGRPAPAPETIVDGLPTDVVEGAPGIVIDYDQASVELGVGHPAYHRIHLALGAEPLLTGDPGAWTDDEEFAPAVAARPIAPAARARLIELWKRGDGRALALPAPDGKLAKVPGVDPASCPDDENMCGEATAIPGTKLQRVIVAFSCGDGCHPEYKVYDPALEQFVDQPWADALQMAWLSADGTTLVHDGAVTRLDDQGTVYPASEDVVGGGWLGASYYIPF